LDALSALERSAGKAQCPGLGLKWPKRKKRLELRFLAKRRMKRLIDKNRRPKIPAFGPLFRDFE
jgi:hypothetical protein